MFELIAAELDSFFPYPFNEEIKGMAQGLDIPVGDIVIANFIYEMTAFVLFFLFLISSLEELFVSNNFNIKILHKHCCPTRKRTYNPW